MLLHDEGGAIYHIVVRYIFERLFSDLKVKTSKSPFLHYGDLEIFFRFRRQQVR